MGNRDEMSSAQGLKTIDLNLDAGENPKALDDGSEERLYQLVSSVNIACGGHAGDERSMRQAILMAKCQGLNIGAHPSYPDRVHFGRRSLAISSLDLRISLETQLRDLKAIAESMGVKLQHVKAHGALYNDIARDRALGLVFLEAVDRVVPSLKIVGLAESEFASLCLEEKRDFVSEAFIDRRYETKSALRSRQLEGAMIETVAEAVEQALNLAIHQRVKTFGGETVAVRAQSLCIHGDSVHAFEFAKAVKAALEDAGIAIDGRSSIVSDAW